MRIEVAYGPDRLTLEVPQGTVVDRFSPAAASSPVDAGQFVTILDECGAGDFLTGEGCLFVVNDGYRSTPTALILNWLREYDSRCIDPGRFLIATGTHLPPTTEHYRSIFGSYIDSADGRTSYHDCRAMSSMEQVGEDRFGEAVWVNRAVLESRQVCFISSIEPHYFAGFTGGRKSLFPGLTDLATVERNHNLANSLDARPTALDGNPVAEHLDELVRLVDTTGFFSIQVVTDAQGNIAGVFCGDLRESFERGCLLAGEIYSHRVTEGYDTVLCELDAPLNRNLYQVQKALENCQPAVKDGGALVVLSPCGEGVGSDHFFQLADSWDRDSNRPQNGVLTFGSHKLARVNLIGKRISACVYSDLPDEDVRRVFYEPAGNLQEFVDTRCKGTNCRLAVVNDAGNTVLHA